MSDLKVTKIEPKLLNHLTAWHLQVFLRHNKYKFSGIKLILSINPLLKP